MLDLALEYFEQEYQRKGGERLILDSYIPADGTYLIAQKKDSGFELLEPVEIKLDKKTRSLDRSPSEMEFLCMADYNSCLVDMNKPVDKAKQIHSCSYLSFFVKKDVLGGGEGPNAKMNEDVIHGYYEALRNPLDKYAGKKKTQQLYLQLEQRIGPPDQAKIDEIETWIAIHLFDLAKEYSGKGYLKIFFRYGDRMEQWAQAYRQEGERYLIPSIFNTNDCNVTVNDEIYGLPNDNMGLNAKKPYLEMKTRKTAAPRLICTDQVLRQKKFFDYLQNLAAAGRVNVYMNENGIDALRYSESFPSKRGKEFSGIYLRLKKGKEVEIHDADVLSEYCNELDEPIELENVFDIELDKLKVPYVTISTLEMLEAQVDQVFFGKMLISNYFNDAKDIQIHDGILLEKLLLTRTALFQWFRKGDERNGFELLRRIGMALVRNSIGNGYLIRAMNQFNLLISLHDYKRKAGVKMGDQFLELRKTLKKKMESKDVEALESDDEYFYAVGQTASFLLLKSRGASIPLSMVNSILNIKKDRQMKEKLQVLFKRHNYDLDLNNSLDRRFRNLYAMVLRYVPDGPVDEYAVSAGFLDKNILFTKVEKEND